MIEQLEHKIFSSFKEWFENALLNECQAYTNVTTPLYPVVDTSLNKTTFSAPWYQWVYDTSVSGAVIPTAASLGVPNVDYINGRTIGGAPTGSVTYALKDFNIYTTTKSDAKLIFEGKYNSRPKPNSRPPVSGMAPRQVLAPCIFLKTENFSTKPHTFGGQICEKLIYSAVIISDDEFKSFGVGAFFGKKKNAVFPYFDDTPLNYLGDYKSGQYNYKQKVEQNKTQDRYVFVERADWNQVEIDSLAAEQPGLFFSKIYFECNYYGQSNLRL